MKEKFEDAKAQARGYFARAKAQAQRAGANVARVASENRELLIAGIPIAIAGIQLGRSQLVSRRLKNERNRIDRTYYDPSTGFHWDLKRKATNADRAKIAKLKAEGVPTYDILMKLNLLK